MIISDIIKDLNPLKVIDYKDYKIEKIKCNYKKIKNTSIYFDFSKYDSLIKKAFRKKIPVIITNKNIIYYLENKLQDTCLIQVDDIYEAFFLIINKFYDYPDNKINLIGINENNKCINFMKQFLNMINCKVAYIINNNFYINNKKYNYSINNICDFIFLLHKSVEEKCDFFITDFNFNNDIFKKVDKMNFDNIIFFDKKNNLDYKLFYYFYNSNKKNKKSYINLDNKNNYDLIAYITDSIYEFGLKYNELNYNVSKNESGFYYKNINFENKKVNNENDLNEIFASIKVLENYIDINKLKECCEKLIV